MLAVAVGAAMAVPQARTAILEFFRLRGATVERVETLAEGPAGDGGDPRPGPAACPTGRPYVKLPEVLVPAALGPPDAAYVSDGGRTVCG